jgi:hypothetical protein
MVATQPKLQPALGIVDHLRRRFACFKLSAHFLDLRSLLLKLCRESLYLFVLLRDRCLQLLNFEIEHGLVAVFGNIRALGNGFGLALGSGLELALRNGYVYPVSIGIDEYRG